MRERLVRHGSVVELVECPRADHGTPQLVQGIQSHEIVTITRHGRAAAVLMAKDDLDPLREALFWLLQLDVPGGRGPVRRAVVHHAPHEARRSDPPPGLAGQGSSRTYRSYMSDLSERSVSEARKNLAAVVDQARSPHQPVCLSRRGRRVAAVIAADDLERLQALAEDMSDILDAEAARAELRNTAAEPGPGSR